jgi:dCMP deaminase
MSDHKLVIRHTINNKSPTVDEFWKSLEQYKFDDKNLVRPNWDTYFMRLAYLIASRTNCMKRAVGSVIVQDKRIIAAGYNGTPFGIKNCNEGGCARCNSMTASGAGLDTCYCIHAEENAVIEAGRQKAAGATIYVTTYPCLMCAKKIA